MFSVGNCQRILGRGLRDKTSRGRASSLQLAPPCGRKEKTLWGDGRKLNRLGMEYLPQLFLQLVLQQTWIQGVVALTQLPALLETQHPRTTEPIISGLWQLVTLAPVAALPPFSLQLQAGQKEVVQRSPSLFVHRTDPHHQSGVFQARVAQKLTRPHPVFCSTWALSSL